MIFGDDEFYYLFDVKGRKFKKLENGVTKPVVSVVSIEGKLYGWVSNDEDKIIIYDGQWKYKIWSFVPFIFVNSSR